MPLLVALLACALLFLLLLLPDLVRVVDVVVHQVLEKLGNESNLLRACRRGPASQIPRGNSDLVVDFEGDVVLTAPRARALLYSQLEFSL